MTIGRSADATRSRPPGPTAPYGSADLRPEIASSWRRSAALGARPDVPLPHRPDRLGTAAPADVLTEAAGPVLELLAARAGGRGAAVLADRRGRIRRRVADEPGLRHRLDAAGARPGAVFDEATIGTSALGTPLEEDRLVQVRGDEHYARRLRGLSGTGAPVVHPLTHRRLGVLAVIGDAWAGGPAAADLVRDAVAQLQDALYDRATRTEQLLLRELLLARRRTGDDVVALDGDVVVMTEGASARLGPDDHAVLRGHAARCRATDAEAETSTTLTSGLHVRVTGRPVHDGDDVAGVLLALRSPPSEHHTGPAPRRLPGLVGVSPAWRAVEAAAQRHRRDGRPLVLRGESGTGRRTLARALAGSSEARDGSHRIERSERRESRPAAPRCARSTSRARTPASSWPTPPVRRTAPRSCCCT